MKVSCVMNTYRRYTCVNRSVRFFLDQDTTDQVELIIYNTDTEYPMALGEELKDKNITIVNNNIDHVTNQPYTNIGSIRRDSLSYAKGKYYICWDDDDIFLPWHIRQGLDGLADVSDAWSWKPYMSMFWKTGHEPELACNQMEASILVNLERLKITGFKEHQGGGEHLSWIDAFTRAGKFHIERHSIPSYCFNWSDQGIMRGHKQSGTINREDNFEYHKANTKDHATGPITGNFNTTDIYKRHASTIVNFAGKLLKHEYAIKSSLIDKYIDVQYRI